MGPARRFEIALCKPGEPVILRKEPNNIADPRAVAVFSAREIKIGYVRAERAQMVSMLIDRTAVSAIFQGPAPWGCNIRIGYDGATAELPAPNDSEAYDWPPPGSEDADWWPDQTWDE